MDGYRAMYYEEQRFRQAAEEHVAVLEEEVKRLKVFLDRIAVKPEMQRQIAEVWGRHDE